MAGTVRGGTRGRPRPGSAEGRGHWGGPLEASGLPREGEQLVAGGRVGTDVGTAGRGPEVRRSSVWAPRLQRTEAGNGRELDTEPRNQQAGGGWEARGRLSTVTQVTRVLRPSAQDDTCDTHQAGEETDRGA